MKFTFIYNDGSTNINYIGWTQGNGDGTSIIWVSGTNSLPNFGADAWTAITTSGQPGEVWNALLYRANCPAVASFNLLFTTSGTGKGFWNFADSGGPTATFTVP